MPSHMPSHKHYHYLSRCYQLHLPCQVIGLIGRLKLLLTVMAQEPGKIQKHIAHQKMNHQQQVTAAHDAEI